MSTTNLQQRLADLFSYIRQGKIIEAMSEFYDKETVMQDNANPPTKGLAANIEREKQFMSGVKEWKGFNVTASAVGDNVTFYECQPGLYRHQRTAGAYGAGCRGQVEERQDRARAVLLRHWCK